MREGGGSVEGTTRIEWEERGSKWRIWELVRAHWGLHEGWGERGKRERERGKEKRIKIGSKEGHEVKEGEISGA